MSNVPVLSDDKFAQIDAQDFMNKTYELIEERNKQASYQNAQPPVQETQPQEEPQQVQEEAQPQYDNPEQESTSSQESIDPAIYKEAYEKITAPFKASGREFQVRNVDEAISLMQKGVDYTRKQQALKPRLLEMRTLEEQGMLGDKLNYAIDLFNGNPQAIAKLIKDKGIDVSKLIPQQQDEFGEPVQEVDTTYTPKNYTISPEMYDFKEACDELKRLNQFNKVADTLEQFDEASKENFRKNPKYLLVLGDMVTSGAYEKIKGELEHARIVDDPSIRGMNDFDAIDVIGNRLYGQGQPVAQPQPQVQSQQPYNPQSYQNQQQQAVQQRKQAVSPVRNAGGRVAPMYDPLHCSDEEFSKIDVNQLLRNYR